MRRVVLDTSILIAGLRSSRGAAFAVLQLVAVRKVRPLDAEDEMILEAAVNGRTDALVTHNVRHFGAASRFSVTVLTPGQYLEGLRL